MLNVTRLLCGRATPGDALRYGEAVSHPHAAPLQPTVHHRPVVVWNVTRRCNLHCLHCYSTSQDRDYPGELTSAEARALLDDLAGYRVPVVLFSGGEPLLRHDLFELLPYAAQKGLRVGLSTNGTLITQEVASRLKAAGVLYAGISIDGMEDANDRFRGVRGAFREALAGIRNTMAVGLRVSLRFTLTRRNMGELDSVFELVEREGIPRLCIYHLAYAGRATRVPDLALDSSEARAAVDSIFRWTQEFHRRGLDTEVLTVDNHADGAYMVLRLAQEDPQRAKEVLALLRRNGGNASGIGIACVDNLGNVHADQFWWGYSFGNVRQRPFSRVWEDTSDPLMRGLKDRKHLLTGRCSRCRFLDICNGNLRVRAEAAHGDVWAADPACYLTDEEIGAVTAGAHGSGQ
ncbi:MAG: radical SAM protein [Chloroflexi bacterium]|nr:radical SAM protein [Chloroflexota bacterium]